MKVDLIQAEELGPEEIARWEEIRSAMPYLSSPYFSPAFTLCAARTRETVRVGILRDGDSIMGFFPFELQRKGVGQPVGGTLSDYQAILMEDLREDQLLDILKGCKLSTWTFDHLIADQSCFDRHARIRSESPVIRMPSGFEDYQKERQDQGSKIIRKMRTMKRKLEKEFGAAKFTLSSHRSDALSSVFAWKTDQCLRTGTFDYFSQKQNRSLIENIHAQRSGDFQGVLSTLAIDETLIAAHFGMRSGSTLHWWLPVYNREFGQYSPGSILLIEVLQQAEANGIDTVDLGKGGDLYKTRFMNDAAPLLEGTVYTGSVQAALNRSLDGMDRFLRNSRWMSPVRRLRRTIKGR